jgi:nucleotide-binding universal stress UspA family protein
MYKHILIATDGSDVGQKGVDHGLALAKALSAKVTVVTVSETFGMFATDGFGYVPTASMVADLRAGQEEAANTILAQAKQAAAQLGISADTLHVPDGQPGEAIIDAATSRGCDLIVMGSHGRRGLGRLVLGSKAAEVVSHGSVPVLVVR